MNDIPARDRDVAMVFQNYALYPHMTVAENLAFGLKMRGAKKSFIQEQVKLVSELLELEKLLNRTPKQLSGGQQQRVALGRAIIRQPKVFLLDEPLSNLDAKLRDQTRTELKKLHAQVGITTIYVTHDQIEAMTLGDRIVILDQGKIQQIGTARDVYTNPANRMVATFLGSPPMNILPATYQDERLWLSQQQSIAIPELMIPEIKSYNGQGWDIGIRPEHIQLVRPDNDRRNGNSYNTIKVKVNVVEPLGKEILTNAIIPGTATSLNLLLPQDWQGKAGDVLKLKLDLQNLFLFEPTTGDRII